jgi:uncharacterized protein YukE
MNVFELFASITLDTDDYEKQLGEAKQKTSTFGDVLKATLTSQAIVTGVKTIANGIRSIGQASLKGYAEYEQLVGGIDTLFGETTAKKVISYAENAYMTAGLSANQYMETVTSFSASLLQSLGGDTEAAAEYANMAITDISDNANKMGSSMESIQNAYQGFAKQNFTMLDNLKLGYGGTKEEMQRLLDKAEEISGIEYDISSYADIVEAIHVVQDEMGIAGATADEAATTISGSAAAMKSAWTNLLTGLAAGNADIDALLNNFLESLKTTAGNVLPVVKTVLTSMGKVIEEKAPEMIAEGVLLIANLALGLIKAIPDLVAKIPEIIRAIAKAFSDRKSEYQNVGAGIVNGIKDGISRAWNGLVSWFKGLWNNLFSSSATSAQIAKQTGFGGARNIDGSHAGGLAYVPFDGYIAELHKGEAVIPAAQARSMRNGEERPINIVVQSVLDGRVIGETAYRYNRDMRRAYGV